jgi:cholesterol oxidase
MGTPRNIPHHTVVVIGSGFGGTMSALSLAREFKERQRGTVLMLERGTWWTTPVGTVQDREVETYDLLAKKGQPVQFWSSAENFRGFIDIYTRCFRRRSNEDGLYDLVTFGERGLLGMRQSDGVSIVRASGVGGGSLVYSNVTIRPPDFVFDDDRWPTETDWDGVKREEYFQLARDAIGLSVLHALEKRATEHAGATPPPPPPPNPINTGLRNIVTRSAGADPGFRTPPTHPGLKQLDPSRYPDPTAERRADDLWIDRARIFQLHMSKLTSDYGTVDSSINDKPIGDDGKPKNYCERQGRCNVGCLPGARHTLNKQLMTAIHGTPRHPGGDLEGVLDLWPLCEAHLVHARPEGGYEVEYLERDANAPWRTSTRRVSADQVILAAGCVGTTELLLRCKERETLPNLSPALGEGFSTNGDYLAFLDDTDFRVSLTRGPVTTSVAHFNTPEADPTSDVSKFHTIEDQGIPRALASLVGQGVPLLQSLSTGQRKPLFTALAILRYALGRPRAYARALFRNYQARQPQFASEDEHVMDMMCIAAQGREASVGRFRLGRGPRETPLRVERKGGGSFEDDPIYAEIRATLARFAEQLTGDRGGTFRNPFLTPAAELAGARSIGLTHPLGGCRMGRDASQGVVDEFGHVFDASKTGGEPFYEGLHVADAAVIPTALGVNPSLTIAALALRLSDRMIADLPSS